MALAVSLTNTGMRHDACEALIRWLKHNPKYKHLLKAKTHLIGSPNSQRRMSYALNAGRHESSLLPEVKELFLEAAQHNSDSVDPDLQTGLGVLYNLSGEFNKAVEAFNTALSVRPEVRRPLTGSLSLSPSLSLSLISCRKYADLTELNSKNVLC
ncbi:PEX5- protein [Ameca splendens]